MSVNFNKYELGNKVVLLMENLPCARTASVGVWIGFGARCETKETLGTAHLIEHMLFKGTADMSPMDIAVAFESVGGSFNAASSKESTRIYARVLTDHIPLAVNLLSDMALRSVFPQDEYDREMRVVLEEIQANQDVPEDIAYDIFFEDFYPGHGLGNNILGTEESVSGISRDTLFEAYRKAYRPAHITVAVAGNLGSFDIPAMVEKALGPDDAERCHILASTPAPETLATSIRLVEKDTHQAQVYLGFPGIPCNSEKRYAYTALDMALSGGMSGRLFQEVREKRGLVYDIASDSTSYSDSGAFYIYAGARADNTLEVLDVTVAELIKLRNGDLKPEELERVKEMYRAGMEMSYESVVSRMGRLARSQLYFGRYVTDEELLDGMNAVTMDDIAQAAGAIFRKDPIVFTALGPFKGKKAQNLQKKIVDVLDKL